MAQWEYTVCFRTWKWDESRMVIDWDKTVSRLNVLGAQGWEAVGAVDSEGSTVGVLLKRSSTG
jgi:hypothetical protein